VARDLVKSRFCIVVSVEDDASNRPDEISECTYGPDGADSAVAVCWCRCGGLSVTVDKFGVLPLIQSLSNAVIGPFGPLRYLPSPVNNDGCN